jgi:hypothetical protein
VYAFSYKVAGKKLRYKLLDEPFKPEERFVRLVEYAARHEKEDNLELYSVKLNFIQQHNLDVYVPIFCVLAIALYLSYKVIKLAIRLTICILSLKQKQA